MILGIFRATAVKSFLRNRLLGLATLVVTTTTAQAGSPEAEALLQSLIGHDQPAIERRIGPPDESESNGVQTFLRYRAFDSWRTSILGTWPVHGSGFAFSGKANFDCLTTLVLREGILRAYARDGTGCR